MCCHHCPVIPTDTGLGIIGQLYFLTQVWSSLSNCTYQHRSCHHCPTILTGTGFAINVQLYLLTQVLSSLSSIMPGGQEHVKPPSVLLHVCEHVSALSLHSSMSVRIETYLTLSMHSSFSVTIQTYFTLVLHLSLSVTIQTYLTLPMHWSLSSTIQTNLTLSLHSFKSVTLQIYFYFFLGGGVSQQLKVHTIFHVIQTHRCAEVKSILNTFTAIIYVSENQYFLLSMSIEQKTITYLYKFVDRCVVCSQCYTNTQYCHLNVQVC